LWLDNGVISEQGTVEASKLDLNGVLDFPKPVELIRRCIQLATRPDDLILDFFAGSATTAHSAFLRAAEENSNRRWIMVQLPEPTYEIKNGVKIAKPNSPKAYESGFETIADVAKERIKRSAQAVKKLYPDFSGDVGFKVFKLASSNIRAWNPDKTDLEKTLLTHKESMVEGRSEQDILYELLLKRGVDLAVPIQEKEFAGKTIFSIGNGALFACLAPSIQKSEAEAVANGILTWFKELKPEDGTQVFFRDSAFDDDNVTKTNIVAILEQNGISHVRSL